MPILLQRRILQCLVLVCACVPVLAGALGCWAGKEMFGLAVTNIGFDSHVRYLSGLLLGIGIAFWNLVPTIERRRREVLLLTLIVFIGGLSRLYGALFVAWPPLAMQMALVMELIVTPVLCIWQFHIAKAYNSQSV